VAIQATDDPTNPDRPPRINLVGTGELDAGATLSVIGDKARETRTLAVTIHLGSWGLPEGVTACVGFMASDVELDIREGYFAELNLPPGSVDELVATVRAGRLRVLQACLEDMRGLYVDSREFARGCDFFLRPRNTVGDQTLQESALGRVTRLIWREQKHVLVEEDADDGDGEKIPTLVGPEPQSAESMHVSRRALRDITVAIQVLAGAVIGGALLIALAR
jgi:hypothetical protein